MIFFKENEQDVGPGKELMQQKVSSKFFLVLVTQSQNACSFSSDTRGKRDRKKWKEAGSQILALTQENSF